MVCCATDTDADRIPGATPRGRWLGLPLAAVLSLALGCDEPRPQGTAVHELPAVDWHERLTIDPEFNPSDPIVDIPAAAAQGDRLYLFERADAQLRVFTAGGEELDRIGGRGEGPGELTSAWAVGISGDTIWAAGRGGYPRLVMFDLEGRHLATRRIDRQVVPLFEPALGYAFPEFMDHEGLFHGRIRLYGTDRSMLPPDRSPGDTVKVPRVRWDVLGNVVDTVGYDDRVVEAREEWDYFTVDGDRYYDPGLPPDDPITLKTTDGSVVIRRTRPTDGSPHRFTVVRTTFANDTLFDRAFLYDPRPYPETVLQSVAERAAARPLGETPTGGMFFRLDGSATDEVRRAIRGLMDVPPFQPPIADARRGVDDWIWLRRSGTGEATDRWIVLDDAGGVVGAVDLPADAELLWSKGREFVLTYGDDFDRITVLWGEMDVPGPGD